MKEAKKYRIYQKVGKKYKLVRELKKNKLTLTEALISKGKKEAFKVGSKYTFKVMPYIDNSWKKKTTNAVVTVKVKK